MPIIDAATRAKLTLLVTSLVGLALLIYAAWQENFGAAWRGHQRTYKEMLTARASSPQQRDVAARLPLEHKQIYLPTLDRVDRCQTCHAAIEDRAMAEAPQPLTAHPGDWLDIHGVELFGCTICHDGQGRATVRDDAHGEVPLWEWPLLRGQDVYFSCGRCHYESDMYGAEQDLYGRYDPGRPVYAAELAATLEGSDRANAGKQKLLTTGCLGCHQYRGKGGLLGPDITHVGDKSRHAFSFANVRGPHTPKQWLFEHFKEPKEVSPGTRMPDFGLSDDEAWNLTAYMLSQHLKAQPARYTPLPTLAVGEPASGAQLYGMFCAACHGPAGEGSEVQGIATPTLNNPDTLAVASDDYLRYIVTHGRPRTAMIPWRRDGGGLLAEEIDTVVAHVRSWAPPGPRLSAVRVARGNANRGAELYGRNCAACHGAHGEGGIGTALNSREFLAIASDEFLRDTLLHGRRNTAMLSWAQLSGKELSDLLAFIRSWQQPMATLEDVRALPANRRNGEQLFRANCANCHGEDGDGDIGPALNSEGLLTLVDTDFLFTTIVNGRPSTAMPAWTHLTSQEVADLIGYVKAWQDGPQRPVRTDVSNGDWEVGEPLFGLACAPCHGTHGEGGDGPQLNNPVLLRSMSDGMLYDVIAHGREDTMMPTFLRTEADEGVFGTWQLQDIVAFVRRWEGRPRQAIHRKTRGSARAGAKVFEQTCARCHGANGEGGAGPALSNGDFLRVASDGYLIGTIILGRTGTEMPAFGQFSGGKETLTSAEINNVVAFIRQWEHDPPPGLPHRAVTGDVAAGREAFEENCIDCHGKNGRGGEAPELNNPGFLAAATNGFLQATIVRGRQGTNMQPYGIGGDGDVALPMQTINDLVAYIRAWDPNTVSVAEAGAAPAGPAGGAAAE